MHLTRRHFLSGAGTAALTGAVIGCSAGSTGPDGAVAADPTPVPASTPAAAATPVPIAADRHVLVVVQLSGGNDGLNTLIPLESGHYMDARPTLGLAEDATPLAGRTDLGLHASMPGLHALWDAGQVAALQGIGLPEQSRSHFVALDTWWAGAADAIGSGGWLGRWMDATSDDDRRLRAVALGGVSPALAGQSSAPVTVQSPERFELTGPAGSTAAVDAFRSLGGVGDASGLLAEAQASIPMAVEAVDALQEALTTEVDDGALNVAGADQLFAAAGDIIEADLGTQVVVVNIGGFDTHANQLVTHAGLLRAVSDGLASLFGRLETSGHAGRTLAMAYSEFGRRVAENGSAGTDHGNGGLAFLVGPSVVSSTVVGDVDLSDLADGDVRTTVDARSLYANALDWLGGPTDEILGGDWDTYGLIAT